MPFLALDNNQKFCNLNKIWTYIVLSVLSTAIAFLLSIALDRLLVEPVSQSATTSGEEELSNNDIELLEPRAQPAITGNELFEHVMDSWRRDSPESTEQGLRRRRMESASQMSGALPDE